MHNHSEVPKLVIADMRAGSMKRYMYEQDVKNSGKVEKFMKEFFDGKLKVPCSRSISPCLCTRVFCPWRPRVFPALNRMVCSIRLTPTPPYTQQHHGDSRS